MHLVKIISIFETRLTKI